MLGVGVFDVLRLTAHIIAIIIREDYLNPLRVDSKWILRQSDNSNAIQK